MKAFLHILLLFLVSTPILAAEKELVGHPLFGVIKETDEVIRDRTRKALVGAGFKVKKEVTRLGDRTIKLESFCNVDAKLDSMLEILSDFKNYNNWITPGFNEKPDGGEYYVKLLSIDPSESKANEMFLFFKLDFPFFKKHLKAVFHVYPTKTPLGFQMRSVLIPQKVKEAVVPRSEIMMKVFPNENDPHKVQVYTAAWLVIRPWLLYEALPERLMTREAGERIQILTDNYIKEELRREKETLARKVTSPEGR